MTEVRRMSNDDSVNLKRKRIMAATENYKAMARR
jgi:hypothetical protein